SFSRDWSSDVCSSDLSGRHRAGRAGAGRRRGADAPLRGAARAGGGRGGAGRPRGGAVRDGVFVGAGGTGGPAPPAAPWPAGRRPSNFHKGIPSPSPNTDVIAQFSTASFVLFEGGRHHGRTVPETAGTGEHIAASAAFAGDADFSAHGDAPGGGPPAQRAGAGGGRHGRPAYRAGRAEGRGSA